MLETPAVVRAVRPGFVSVEPTPAASCEACAGRCATRRISEMFSARPRAFDIAVNERYAVGERVIVTIPERSFLAAVLRGYALPLVGLLLGAFVAVAVWPTSRDWAALGGGLAGMFAAALWARRHAATGIGIARVVAVSPLS